MQFLFCRSISGPVEIQATVLYHPKLFVLEFSVFARHTWFPWLWSSITPLFNELCLIMKLGANRFKRIRIFVHWLTMSQSPNWHRSAHSLYAWSSCSQNSPLSSSVLPTCGQCTLMMLSLKKTVFQLAEAIANRSPLYLVSLHFAHHDEAGDKLVGLPGLRYLSLLWDCHLGYSWP